MIPVNQPWHICAYGNPGVGKSPFAATMEKPIKVFFFDGLGKDWAYLSQGHPSGVKQLEDGGLFQAVMDDEGKMIVEIEYFADIRPHMLGKDQKLQAAWDRYVRSMTYHQDNNWEGFKSAVVDSVTYAAHSIIMVEQFRNNPTSKGGEKQNAMQWHGAAKLGIQTWVLAPLIWAPIHTMLVCHVDSSRVDQQEKHLWGVNAPGTLRGDIPGAFPETYLVYEEDGKTRLMTRSDEKHIARSDRRVTDRCPATWEALLANVNGGKQ